VVDLVVARAWCSSCPREHGQVGCHPIARRMMYGLEFRTDIYIYNTLTSCFWGHVIWQGVVVLIIIFGKLVSFENHWILIVCKATI